MHDSPPRRSAVTFSSLTVRPLRGHPGLMLCGDADLTVQDQLHAALAALPADQGDDIHLDLSGLRFIDVTCARELIAFSRRHPAGRVVIHHPPAALLRITALLDPDAINVAREPGSATPELAPPAPGDSGTNPDAMPISWRGLQAVKPEADIVGRITRDHTQITELFSRIGQLTGSFQSAPGGHGAGAGGCTLSQAWAALARLLGAYTGAGQEVLQSVFAAAPPSTLRHAWTADLCDIGETLAEARLAAVGSDRWLRAVSDACTAVIHHIQAAHEYLLPALRHAPLQTRQLLARQWAAFADSWQQDDAEAATAGSCAGPRPSRRRAPGRRALPGKDGGRGVPAR